MKNKSINSILAICSLAWGMSACTDVWEEHYQAEMPITGDSIKITDNNLWQEIKSDSTLSEFAQILKVTGCDSLLMTDRVYTVWAPKNGSQLIDDKSKLQNPSKEDIERWKKRIVENHISNVNIQVNGIREKVKENNIEMLNKKSYYLLGNSTGYTIQDKNFVSTNILTKNGMLHKVDGYLEFMPTIWEQLADEPEVSELWKFLSKDYEEVFNPSKSIEGPIVNNTQTWLDSVFDVSCRWFHEIGYLDEVDSSYTMYALTDRAWGEMTETVKKYYQYADDFKSGQSKEEAIDSIAHELMCRNLVFSNNLNKDFFDGNSTELKSNHWWKRLTFKDEDAKKLEDGKVKEVDLYNGRLVIVDAVNYKPFTWGYDTIRIEGESLSNNDEITTFTDANKSYVGIHRDSLLYDSLSNHAVGVFTTSERTNPNFKFYVPNVLSAYYTIKIVLLPPQLINPSDTTFLKPNKFDVAIQTPDTLIKMNETFISDSSKVLKGVIDTMVLAEKVYIPVCEHNCEELTGSSPETYLRIESALEFGNRANPKDGSSTKDKSDWKYDNNYRIDQVIFEPIRTPEENN